MKKHLKNAKKEYFIFRKGLNVLHRLEPGLIICSLCMAITDSIFPFINIYITSELINDIISGTNYRTMFFKICIALCLNLFFAIINHALNRLREVKNSSFYFKYCLMISYKNHDVAYDVLEKYQMREDYQKVYENIIYGGVSLIHKYLYQLLRNIFSCIAAAIMSWRMIVSSNAYFSGSSLHIIETPFTATVILILIIFAAAFSAKLCVNRDKELFRINNNQASSNKFWMFYEREYLEDIKCGKEVRIFNQHNLIIKEIEKVYNKLLHCEKDRANTTIKCGVGESLIIDIVNFVIYILVALKCLIGTCTVGSIVQYTQSINRFVCGVSGFVTTITQICANNRYIEDFEDFLDFFQKNSEEKIPTPNINLNELEIAFENVSFCYPNSKEYALRNVTFKIKKGERFAIVGMNGSGKTTLVKLLCRFYTPNEGRILINGININDLDLNDYLNLLSVVFQDFKFIGFSIGNNVSSNKHFNKEKVEKCLKKAGFQKNIDIDIPINKEFFINGIELSGGEAQRVAISRALYKDSPLIILDEPTAELDPLTEADIYEKLDELLDNKTAIYISHRLSSCKFCDKIIVLDNGVIVQDGVHDDLVKVAGKYKELWCAQAQYYT